MPTEVQAGFLRCAHAAGRGDLVRLLRDNVPREHAAALLGFRIVEQEARVLSGRAEVPVTEAGASGTLTTPGAVNSAPPLWRAIGPYLREPEPTDRQPPACLTGATSRTGRDLAARSHDVDPPRPLVPVSRLAAVLRRLACVTKAGAALDEQQLVRLLARLRPVLRLPRRLRLGWTPRLQVYWDRAEVLGSCWHDQASAIRWLERWRGPQGLETVVVGDDGRPFWYPRSARGQKEQARPRPVRPADAGTTVLALSDLGFASAGPARSAWWTALRQHAGRAGGRCRALALCPRGRWDSSEAARWMAVEWERPRERMADLKAGDGPSAPLEALFVRLSPAIRVDSGLLRAVRLFTGRFHAGVDLGTELDVWMDRRVIFRNPALGMMFNPKDAQVGRAVFATLSDSERRGVLALLARFHGQLAPDILAEEQLACGVDVEQAEQVIAGHARGLWESNASHESMEAAQAAYVERVESRQSPRDWRNDAIAALWALANRNKAGTDFVRPVPRGLDVARVLWALDGASEPTWWRLWQHGRSLRLLPDGDTPRLTGSLLSRIRLRLPRVTLAWQDDRPQTLELRPGESQELPLQASKVTSVEIIGDLGSGIIELAELPAWADRLWRDRHGLWVSAKVRGFRWREKPERWRSGRKKPHRQVGLEAVVEEARLLWPSWALRVDRDEHGLFAILQLAAGLETRLRWVPPGGFLMGSPAGEGGRFDDEGPEHWVELSCGFWLADAPCTQAEWSAVMGTTPSRFKGEDRPVEQVSWDDCQAFCERLRTRVPDLGARLPTETEWEYACRAGTTSAFNDGSACTEPQGKDPALERLGWYAENSGGETHAVRGKAANAWGLYDMHGNVWEWCGDWYGPYLSGDQEDPPGAAEGRGRVPRGGSWVDRAGFCRSAYRSGWLPSGRRDCLGFRLASGQVSSGSETSERPESSGPEARGVRRRASGKQQKG